MNGLGSVLVAEIKGLVDGFSVGLREREKARLLACARRCTREPLTEMGKMGEKGEGAGRAQVLSFVVFTPRCLQDN